MHDYYINSTLGNTEAKKPYSYITIQHSDPEAVQALRSITCAVPISRAVHLSIAQISILQWWYQHRYNGYVYIMNVITHTQLFEPQYTSH